MGKLSTTWFPALSLEERERRLQLFRTFLIVQVIGTLGFVSSGVADNIDYPLRLVFIFTFGGLSVVLSLTGYWVGRRGRVHAGVLLLVVCILSILVCLTVFYGARGTIPFFYIWPIMVSAVLLETPLAFLLTTLAAAAFASLTFLEWSQLLGVLPLFRPERFAFWHKSGETYVLVNYISTTLEVILVYFATVFLSWVASRSLQQMVSRSQAQAVELEGYQVKLEENVAELRQATQRLEASLEVVREVGSLVLPVFEGVLLAPLIGVIDSERAQTVMEQVLTAVSAERAQAVILDITGVPVVDTFVTKALVQMAQGVCLLGAVPVLVGIRAEVAETMVDLGVDLQGVVTRSSLQEGLKYALEQTGVKVVAAEDTAKEELSRPSNELVVR